MSSLLELGLVVLYHVNLSPQAFLGSGLLFIFSLTRRLHSIIIHSFLSIITKKYSLSSLEKENPCIALVPLFVPLGLCHFPV
jgi:hypothetical protein